jgi:hypothetical protein
MQISVTSKLTEGTQTVATLSHFLSRKRKKERKKERKEGRKKERVNHKPES